MNSIHHEKHEALRFWFKDFVKQAHIKTAAAPNISEVSPSEPNKATGRGSHASRCVSSSSRERWQVWSHRLQHYHASCWIILRSCGETTPSRGQNQRGIENSQVLSSLLKYGWHTLWAFCRRERRSAWSKSSRNILKDLQFNHPNYGTKWIFYSALVEI